MLCIIISDRLQRRAVLSRGYGRLFPIYTRNLYGCITFKRVSSCVYNNLYKKNTFPKVYCAGLLQHTQKHTAISKVTVLVNTPILKCCRVFMCIT